LLSSSTTITPNTPCARMLFAICLICFFECVRAFRG
jgi:hypothetical protein